MKNFITYEFVSGIMLLITIFFYIYKNWLSLRKNSIYMRILLLSIIAITADGLIKEALLYLQEYREILQKLSGVVLCVAFPVLYFHILLYDLSFAKQMRVVRSNLFKGCLAAGIGFVIFSVGIALYDDRNFIIKIGYVFCRVENIVQAVLLSLCMIAALYFLFRSHENLTYWEFYVLVGTDVVFLLCAPMQMLFSFWSFLSYYILSLAFLLYYLLLHNADQYRFLSSRCFSRAGFNKVVEEKAHYLENFACLGICINNIDSITNYCTEQEIVQLHRRLGEILRYYCGRHSTYNIHSFEYMTMLKSRAGMEKLHQELAEGIPQYIRIHEKNIPVVCDFFVVEFADAGYDVRDFNRILSSMRKLAAAGLERSSLLCYQGEKQLEIQNDLEAMRIVNENIANRRFHYQMLPIQSLQDFQKKSYEMVICETLENGTVISQERIWDLAAETGYSREIGRICCEMLCDYIQEEKVEENDAVEAVHLNLFSAQFFTPAAAEEYVKILSQRNISGNRICFEITVDEDVDYQILTKSCEILKSYGIRLMLDQFGVCVCNLTNVLNMPFDYVKINNYMVQIYCIGESRQLVYLIHMFQRKNWSIYLDGVDRLDQIETLCKLKVSAIQGQALFLEPFQKKMQDCIRKMGGASGD